MSWGFFFFFSKTIGDDARSKCHGHLCGIMTTSLVMLWPPNFHGNWHGPKKKRLPHAGMILFPVVCSRIPVPSLGSISFFSYPYSPYICWKPHPPEKNRKFSNVSVELIVLLNYKPLETVARCRDCNDPGVLNSHIFIYVPYKKPRFLRFPEASESWAKSCWAIFKLNVHAPKSEICWRSFLGLPQT